MGFYQLNFFHEFSHKCKASYYYLITDCEDKHWRTEVVGGTKKKAFLWMQSNRELLHCCHLSTKMNDISKSALLIIVMHPATGKMRTRDLPNNHMQVFYFMSAGSSLLRALFRAPNILLGFTKLQNTPDAD